MPPVCGALRLTRSPRSPDDAGFVVPWRSSALSNDRTPGTRLVTAECARRAVLPIITMVAWPILAVLQEPPPRADIAVPRGRAPVLDGKVDSLEWADALRAPLGRSGSLDLKHDGRELYLGIQGEGPIIAGVCLARGDTIQVLHASAALGAAVYGPGPGGTAPRSRLVDFSWGLRDSSAPIPASSREAWLAQFGWLASTFGMGMSAREWRLPLAGLPTMPRVAVVLFRPVDGGVDGWPPALEDDCLAPSFALGMAPAAARFAPEGWARLSLLP